MRVSEQPGYILHARPYRETSLLVDVLSRDHGQIGIVARGVRKEKSRWKGLLQPLQALLFTWTGRSDLVTLTALEAGPPLPSLAGDRLFAGMYLNELVLRIGRRGEGQGGTYPAYELCLQRLASGDDPAWCLRRFERDFLADLGYALRLDRTADDDGPVDADRDYGYDVEGGAIDVHRVPAGGLTVRGASLLALASDVMPDSAGLRDLRRLMRVVIRHHLSGGNLNAWELRLR